MASDTQAQKLTIYHGADENIVLTGEDNTDPTSYTMAMTFAAYPGGSAVLTIPSFTIGGSGPYTITAALTRAQTGITLSANLYYWDLWRTDSGSNKRLAGGTLELLPPVRAAA